jgi:hypothetical protein
MTTPVIIKSSPGIKRDGTELEGQNYVDGEWVRFQRGLPRKMGGYRSLTSSVAGNARAIHVQVKNRYDYIHLGSSGLIERILYHLEGTTATVTDRTPAGITDKYSNYWAFDSMYDSFNNQMTILAHLSNGCPCSTDVPGELYSGDIYGLGALTLVPAVTASSGILALPPFMLAYGSDGYVQWSEPNDPTNFTGPLSGAARVTAQKIQKGFPLRGGGGYSPACLLWSVDSVIRGMYIGGDTQWQWDTLSSQSSLLAPTGIVENDGVYYWAGNDRFLMFNGVVREIPNQLNLNWFFDNLNYGTRCFAMKNPRWGEIWWCYPRGSSNECTHAVIYNYREDYWYDTVLPNGGRGAGVQNTSSPGVMMSGNVKNDFGKYDFWHHEQGTDEIDGLNVRAIRSYFETADMFLADTEKPSDMGIHIDFIEPDFVQSGDMTVYVKTRPNARAPFTVKEQKTFSASAADSYAQVVPLKTTGRQMRLRFESNVTGGDYQMGQVIGHIAPSTAKVL